MTRRRDDALTAAPSPASPLSRRAFLAGSAGGAALALAGCATGAKQLFSGGSSGTTITVAIVSNSQMQDAISQALTKVLGRTLLNNQGEGDMVHHSPYDAGQTI